MPHRAPDPLPRLDALDMERHLRDPRLKQAWVTPMFDLIAPRYDRFTRWFSFGMDRRWKSALVRLAAETVPRGACVLDVATGTGDLALGLLRVRPDVSVAGVDVSARMLAVASDRRRQEKAGLLLAAGDLSALPVGTATVGAVMAGYALRNAPDWRAGLGELARVTAPGASVFTLDFYLPAWRPWRRAFLAWLSGAGRAVGWWWHREPLAYGYIARSIEHFTTAGGFSRALVEAGFTVRAVRPRLGGGIALHHAIRR